MVDTATVEKNISCPWCAERMTVILDLSAGAQSYVEDCQVCCQPMQLSFDAAGGELDDLRVDRAV